ncbi:hypothetical protein FAGKG844_890004 [Frankia sp. AgKG'84/4]
MLYVNCITMTTLQIIDNNYIFILI